LICEIPALETLKALKFAKDLDELIVDEAFTFNANMKWYNVHACQDTKSEIFR